MVGPTPIPLFAFTHFCPFSESSTVIQEAKAMCDAGLALVAYFYFDFRDNAKQDIRGLLSSIVTQLSAESDACYNILSDLYSAHYAGSQLPDDDALVRCLKDMLQLPDQPPIYLIVDAVDECPDSTGVVSPRERVLGLIEDLVESRLSNLRLCITSRPEADILDVLEPLASHIISLHDEEGQKQDIVDYINVSVQSDRKMRRWRGEDRQLVIDALIEKADGMYVIIIVVSGTAFHLKTGSDGFFANWRHCVAAFRQRSVALWVRYPNLWTIHTSGYC